MHLRHAVGYCALLALVVLSGRAAHADALVRDGLGAISMGRGGTNLGFFDNAAIISDNAAAMSNVAGKGLFDASIDTLITDLQYSDPQNADVQAKTRPFVVPTVGYVRHVEDSDLTWGIGAFVPAGFGADYHMNSQFAGPQQYKSLGGLGRILPALSYKVTDRLSIGGTFGLAFSDVQLAAPYVVQSGPFAGVPTVASLHAWGVAPTGSFGAQYFLTDDTVLGFNWQSRTTLDMRGSADATVFLPAPFGALPGHYDSKVHISWPGSAAFGVRHNLCPHRIISAEVLWYDWSHSFTNLPISFTNPTNPTIAALAPAGITDHFPLGWLNSVSLRTGYQWMPNDRDTYRLGYVYHASPVPNATLNPIVDGVLEHTFSAGYSRQLKRCQFNAAYQYSFAPTRYVGASQIIGPGGTTGDYANSAFKAQVHYISLGLLVPF
jgi:long-chain fatty acid transport protein